MYYGCLWGHEVKIWYVNGHEFGVSCGDYTVEKELCYQHIYRGHCYLTGIVDSISSDEKTGSVIFNFFISYTEKKGTIGDIRPSGARYVLLFDELDRVGGIFDAASDPIG